jgi:hypothetical protein
VTSLYPYTEEDVARGYTIEHGRGGTTVNKPIPPAVWAALALGRIAAALEKLAAGRGEG